MVLAQDADDALGLPTPHDGGLETRFDAAFAARLALPEKQIQQNYRPIIGVHKWFARRPGTLFRNLLLAEFVDGPTDELYWKDHHLTGTIADPFMGGGTPLIEANRLGFDVVGADVNPMAYWIVRQSLRDLDIKAFLAAADDVASEVEAQLGELYVTTCVYCHDIAPVKYFLWVKQHTCPDCGTLNDLFPGYLLAENARHPNYVYLCPTCGELSETASRPVADHPCEHCSSPIPRYGPARRNQCTCGHCGTTFRYPDPTTGPPAHRLWAMEYHCPKCKPGWRGRFFKRPDEEDVKRVGRAEKLLVELGEALPIPDDPIPPGDESTRLHRWGYTEYREMFTARQLVGLGTLLAVIMRWPDLTIREALLTVFSDSLRYQNLLARYDTMALKCQDIFSVHGFPVGLVQCENVLLGTPKVGSGAFRHFVAKYRRAKEYGEQPFETRIVGRRKTLIPIIGERIGASLVDAVPDGLSGNREPQALLVAASAETLDLAPGSLDGVFTDPPYFDNVQYAELIDFCYVWLRRVLAADNPAFVCPTTRNAAELTGNATEKRDLVHFTSGLSTVVSRYAAALKPGAPFVFTYHHNDLSAYTPLVVALLDAGLTCSQTLPAAAEMEASLHIAKTASSILDTVFVCRAMLSPATAITAARLRDELVQDCIAVAGGGVNASQGDVRCLALGHLARATISELRPEWNRDAAVEKRLSAAQQQLRTLAEECGLSTVWEDVCHALSQTDHIVATPDVAHHA